MSTGKSLIEIKELALTLIIKIQNNLDAKDDELEETFSDVKNTMSEISQRIDNFIQANSD
jgi:hypothetical protein